MMTNPSAQPARGAKAAFSRGVSADTAAVAEGAGPYGTEPDRVQRNGQRRAGFSGRRKR
jgi:hypothetical protein